MNAAFRACAAGLASSARIMLSLRRIVSPHPVRAETRWQVHVRYRVDSTLSWTCLTTTSSTVGTSDAINKLQQRDQ